VPHRSAAAAWRSIVEGRGFSDAYGEGSGPTAHVAPIYPLFLAVIFSIWGLGKAGAVAVMIFGILQVVVIQFLL
jgi:hypothetical protein